MALWCAVFDRGLGQRPGMIKQVFADFPAGTAAGQGRFRGRATMGEQVGRWDPDQGRACAVAVDGDGRAAPRR